MGAAAAPAPIVQQALSLLPDCYSAELETCWGCKPEDAACIGRSIYPNCAYINAGWKADHAAIEKAIEALPFCAAPPTRARQALLLGGATAVGLLLGLALGTALR